MRPSDEDGDIRCEWTPAPEDFDCSKVPTIHIHIYPTHFGDSFVC